jgi:hypothetical protein
MAHIDPSLLDLSDNQAAYNVLITLKDNAGLPAQLSDKGHFVLKDKIFAASITPAELHALSSDAAIDAIEPDSEMGIL